MIDYSIAIRGTKPGVKKENIEETRAYGVAQRNETLTLRDLRSTSPATTASTDKATSTLSSSRL